MRWFRVALLLSFIVLLAWFIWSVFAQKSLFDWLGDRIDHITDDTNELLFVADRSSGGSHRRRAVGFAG